MRLGIILTILAVPICAQATLCEQYMTISDQIRKGRGNAEREWSDRGWLRMFGDKLAGVKRPEAVLEVSSGEATTQLASHFDEKSMLPDGRVRLVRYPNPARDAYERINHFETVAFDRLRETEYAIHLAASDDHPAYLAGAITRMFDGGFDFLDFQSRMLYRVEASEFISAKMADFGGMPAEKEKRNPGEKNSIWENTCGTSLIELLKSKAGSAARLILQVQDGSSYGIQGFHKVVIRHLEKLQFNDKGIFIPELNIVVPSQQVLAVSAS